MTLIGTVAQRLRAARERTGLTQDKAAKAVGIHRVQLSHYETGRREIDISTLARLAALYGYTPDHFLADADEEEEDEEQVNVAFRAEDVSASDLEIVAWAKNFVLAAYELDQLLQGGK
ncbi:MAG: helix-turn-helix transcriptional regulator [Bacillota bacterium]